MDKHAAQALGLAQDLSGLRSDEDYYAAALVRLSELFPCEQVFWTTTDFARRHAVVLGDQDCSERLAVRLGLHGADHPGIQSYVADPTDLSPRRVSDVVGQRHWHACAAYGEIFSEFGSAHQLSLVTRVSSAYVGTGWTLTRSGGDFTDAEVDLASHILPVLTALERVHGATNGAAANRAAHAALTARERQVLLDLAEGRTARAIARRLGITERTVRKHLSAIYDKLACRDRLVAVARARDQGLLP